MPSFFERVRTALAPRGYDVLRELASGGMGTVFLARQVALDRRVAVKIIRPELYTALGAERFRQEATTLAGFSHPNIVPIHDADEADGMPYYIMDYLEGETLADRLRRGPLPAAQALKLGRDLLDALGAAHVHGVVHRDVKPSNVFLVGGRGVLVDFGIAKRRSREAADTAPGAVIGTVDYMPPEQAAGAEVTERTDLYAAGMVIFEAYTGRHWFEAQRDGAPRLWRRVPGRVARVLRRALEFDPGRRWPNAAAFRHALWRTRVRVYQWRTAWLAALGLIVGAAVIEVWGPTAGRASPSPADVAIVPFKAEGGADPKLGWNLPRLAALNLQAFPRLTVVDPRTSFNWWDAHGRGAGPALSHEALHARHLVQGDILTAGDSLEVRVFVLDRRGVVLSAPVVRGVRADPEGLGNRIALQLVLALRPDLADRFQGSPDLSQRSVQALNLFLDGEDAFNHDDWLLAEQRYDAALALDSTFALAQWRLANVQRWRRMPMRVDLKRLYARQRAYLSERDRLLLAAQLAHASAERFALYDTVLIRYPRDAYAALLFGSELLSRGALAGVPLDSALVVLQRAVQLDSSLLPAYDHLAWAAIRLGRRDDALAAIQALRRLPAPRAAMDLDFAALLDLTFTSRFGPAAIPASAQATMLADLARGLRFGLTFDVPEAQVAFGAVLAGAPAAGRGQQANGHEAQALALLALGRVGEALTHFDSAAALLDQPDAILETAQWRVLLDAFGIDAVDEAERRRGTAMLERWAADPRLGGRAAWALASAAYARGDTAAGARWLARVERRASADSGAARLAVLTQAVRLARRGDYTRALELSGPLLVYDSAGRGGDPFARAALHIRRAEWFERLGRDSAAAREWLWHDNADAVDWPVGVAQAGDVDWALGTYARLRRGRLALARGATQTGCPLVRRVAELWARADAALEPLKRAADSLALGCAR